MGQFDSDFRDRGAEKQTDCIQRDKRHGGFIFPVSAFKETCDYQLYFSRDHTGTPQIKGGNFITGIDTQTDCQFVSENDSSSGNIE